MGPQRGWDTYPQPHSKWWKEIGAPDIVVTENFCAHRLGGEGWVESGLKPLRAVMMEQRGSRDKPCFLCNQSWELESQVSLSICPGPWLPQGSNEV